MLVDVARRHPWVVGAMAGVALGLAGGLLWPLPTVPPAAASEGQVALPGRGALERYAEADFTSLRNSSLWSGSAGAQPGSNNMLDWRLLGVVLRPNGAALVQVENRQLSVAIGGMLPDGAELIAVSGDSVVFRRGDCDYRRQLYETTDEALPSDGCAPAQAPSAVPQAAGN